MYSMVVQFAEVTQAMSQPPQRYEMGQLVIALQKAIRSGKAEQNPVLHAQRLARLAELDSEAWTRLIANLPELALYQTLTEGMLHTADALDLPLPAIEDCGPELLGMPRGTFSYVADDRSLRVFAFGSADPTPFYAVDLFGAEGSYQGDAPSLVELTRLVSDWLAQGLALSELLSRYAWMRSEPVRATWRMHLDQGEAGDR